MPRLRLCRGASGLRRREELDRDESVEGHIAGEEHNAHATAAQLSFERIAAGNGLLEFQKFWTNCVAHFRCSLPCDLVSFASASRWYLEEEPCPMYRKFALPTKTSDSINTRRVGGFTGFTGRGNQISRSRDRGR